MTIQTDIQLATNRAIAYDIIWSIYAHGSVRPMMNDIVDFQGIGLYQPIAKLLECTDDEAFDFIYRTIGSLERAWNIPDEDRISVDDIDDVDDIDHNGCAAEPIGPLPDDHPFNNIVFDPLTGLKYDTLTGLTSN